MELIGVLGQELVVLLDERVPNGLGRRGVLIGRVSRRLDHGWNRVGHEGGRGGL